jgi:hypothetical protein
MKIKLISEATTAKGHMAMIQNGQVCQNTCSATETPLATKTMQLNTSRQHVLATAEQHSQSKPMRSTKSGT